MRACSPTSTRRRCRCGSSRATPSIPGSRGRNCAKGPATLNQITDPDRILYPLKRAGKRGEGKWEQVSWDEALDDIAARIRKAIVEDRRNEIMYHVGRPGEDGFTERILAAWGVDGHNSHTNICSSGARAGYQFWMGLDRPSPDHANARVILLISAHLESGHYFNPHAQRVIDGKANGAKLIVFDTRLSNTATHADHWLAPYPGSEAAILLAIANYLIQHKLLQPRVRAALVELGGVPGRTSTRQRRATFEDFERLARRALRRVHVRVRGARVRASTRGACERSRSVVATPARGSRLTTGAAPRPAIRAAGRSRAALFMLNALLGAVATEGGVFPERLEQVRAAADPHCRRIREMWNELTWPHEYPLSMNEMSFLLPHFLKEGRGKLDVYFTRVYNPVWTNPDGFSWIEALTDETLVGCHVALTPTWSETAFFADYVLPMGLGSERHDIHSYETHDAQWLGFRQPVLRAARERARRDRAPTRGEVNPGEVWEENEFWIELTWRIDPDGSLGIRQFFESKRTRARS